MFQHRWHTLFPKPKTGNQNLHFVFWNQRHRFLVQRQLTILCQVSLPQFAKSELDRQKYGVTFYSNTRNLYTNCCLLKSSDDSSEDINSDSDVLATAEDFADVPLDLSDLYEDQYLNPSQGHKVFIVHPAIKTRRRDEFPDGTSTQLTNDWQLAEACSLIDALPHWTIVGKEIVQVPQLDKSQFFSKGIFYQVLSLITGNSEKTAVFVNTSLLSGLQLATLQKVWHVPVYDRYTIILQIFHLRARTAEAKLQLKLAEVPYYRSRLRGMHIGTLDQQRGGLNYIGGSGETWIDTRYRIMAEKELRIRKKLDSLKKKRHLLWRERKKKELPLVAVVGYTNAGKTSLIRALTKDTNLQPWDQVFATLDVTCHAGYLGNRVKVVYMDTVGFISNIPTNLIEAFSATLEDVSRADVIIHVKDVSHPCLQMHSTTVMETLTKLRLHSDLMDNVIDVNNKVDLITNSSGICANGIGVSTVTGEGITQLLELLEDAVIKQTGRVEKLLKIPQSGPHLAWLYKEATVKHCQPVDDDGESILVSVVMTRASYEKFCAQFSNKNRRKQINKDR